MTSQEQINRVDQLFSVLRLLEPSSRSALFSAGQVIDLPTGQMLMQQNQQCRFVPLVLSGQLRVYTVSENGREMNLFRTVPGDTCLLSIACQIKKQDFPALAEVEHAASLFMIPVQTYHQILAEHPAWKNYIIVTLYSHLTSVMQTLEAVAFSRTDKRLAEWLLDHKPDRSRTIRCTHEAIAIELGTAREVISRLLGDLKNQGAIELGRGRIEILQPAALHLISQSPG